jgi:transcriptional regulator with XRE-family HTH domain
LREQIRLYRKACNVTLEELGKRISKSKATVWKYENGLIDVDIKTMFEIADALGVSFTHLIDSALIGAGGAQGRNAGGNPAVGDRLREYFMYYYDGYSNKVSRSLIRVSPEREEASMFYHIDSFAGPDDCRDFYTGNVSVAAPYMNLIFRNVNNHFETLFIVAKEPFKKQGVMKGLLTGISYKVFQPLSFKVIISEYELDEDGTLSEWLTFSKSDLSQFRKHNALVLSEEYDNFKPKNSR